MPDTLRSTAEIISMLADGPRRIADSTRGVPPEALVTPPEAGAWSARDILGHLRACGDMWGQAITRILSEARPAFKAVNPRGWILQTDYLAVDFQASLAAFSAQRADLLARLKPLSAADWEREALVSVAGKPVVRTVYGYALWLADHERSHLKQIERIAARGAKPGERQNSD